MKRFDFYSEKAQGDGECWEIISTTDYQRQPQDYLDTVGDEAVMAGVANLQGYMYSLIPIGEKFIVKIDLIETKEVLVSGSLSLEQACDLIKNLNSMSIKGIKRVWQAKKWDKGITILQNDLNFTYRKET